MQKMTKMQKNIVLSVFLIIGLLITISGVSGTAGKLQEFASTLNPDNVPESMNLAPVYDTLIEITEGQTVSTSTVYAENPTYFVWYMDGIQVYGGYVYSGESYSSIDMPSGGLGVGDHSLICVDQNYGDYIEFTVRVYAVYVPTPTPTPFVPTPTPFVPTPTPFNPTPTPFNPTPTPFVPTPTPTPQVQLTTGVSGQGTVSPSPGVRSYSLNAQVTISATASNGYTFNHWLFDDNSQSSSATLTLTMSRSRTALAIFTANPTPTPVPPAPTPTPIPQVTLTMGTSGQGSIYPTAGSRNYDIYSQVTISATANYGYVFSYWIFNDGSQNTNSIVTLTLSQSRSALAVFTAIPQATPTPNPSATVNPNPTATPTPTPQPTALPIATPNPTTNPNPTSTPEPTPIPIDEPSPTPQPSSQPYINVNELFTVGGLSIIVVDALAFALVNGFFKKKF